MSATGGATRTIKVTVPKPFGKRVIRTLGIYLPENGIISVDIPHELRFGDEFEYTLPTSVQGIGASGVMRVPVPDGVVPGAVFKHRAPNGKKLSVSCPPGASDNSELLIPWSDSTNEYFVIQAYVASPPIESPVRKPYVGANHSSRNQRINHAKPVENDLLLAQALSLTTLQPQGVRDDGLELKKALKASLQDYHPAQVLLKDRPIVSEEEMLLKQVLQQSIKDRTEDELELERAMKASLKHYRGPDAHCDDDDDLSDGLSAHEFTTQRKKRGQRNAYQGDNATDDMHATASYMQNASLPRASNFLEDNVNEEDLIRLAQEMSLDEARKQAERQIAKQELNCEHEACFPRQSTRSGSFNFGTGL